MITAALCSIEYGVMIDLEYYGILKPFIIEESLGTFNHDWSHLLYKMVFTMGACFAVAYLSSILSEQAKNTENQLVVMEDHIKRVEKMAAVGEMAAGLAHELKNPLASLTGSIQLLREDTQFNSYHDKLIQIFLREAGRLNDLVNNFLMYAKPPSRMQGKATEIRRELDDTIRLFEKDNLCKERIRIINNLNEEIWTEMDPVHLRQILLNLLLNAAESIEDTGLINIKISNTSEHSVALEIFDTGCGMTDETIQSIFDPFFTTKQKGTGLGLSIVHNILEAYGNRIDVKSTINKGTTFIVHFKKIDPHLLQTEYSKVYTNLPSLAHG
jgi:two-component system sensor histidine kinase PilS (NtrC family)